jgi:hypothetical protein
MIIPVNEEIYDLIKDEANKKFVAGLYKDAFIIKNYLKTGEEFEPETYKDSYFIKVLRFIGEQWTDVKDYLEDYLTTPITKLANSKCIRPTIRIDNETPLTIQELIKIHGKKKLLDIYDNKKDDEKIIWKTGKIFKSKL